MRISLSVRCFLVTLFVPAFNFLKLILIFVFFVLLISYFAVHIE
jgi:hypothetical protein